MPVVAVVGAAIAIGVAVEAATVFTIIAAVGATVAAIGAVTNNQTLMMVGGIVGAVGAVGGLAGAAGLISDISVASGVGSTADIAAGASGQVGEMGAQVAANAANVTPDIVNEISGAVTNPATTALPQGILDAGTAVPGSQPGPLPGSEPLSPDENMMATMPKDTGTANTTTGTQTPQVQSPAAVDQNVLTPSQQAAANPGTVKLPDGMVGTDTGTFGTPPAQPTSIWGKITNTLASPTVAAGLIQAGGAFLSGATSTLTPAQVKAYEAQATANTATANLANQQASIAQQQASNIGQPIPTSVTGQGLINNQGGRSLHPPVTGRVQI